MRVSIALLRTAPKCAICMSAANNSEATSRCAPGRVLELETPKHPMFAELAFETANRPMSTTIAFVRMLTALLKDGALGRWIVPVVADEARTFGMESLFPKIGIYSHCGQLYEPADQGDLLHYKESIDGQILEEGITEAGALSSWIAAGTAYSNHNIPTVPFFIYYSIFGFQREGDLIWAAADSRARGFLLGATAGRTTLSGEGLQHQDGTSHLIASTIPTCRAYDPCFAYELAIILENGLSAILERQEDVFYYLTLMNENYVHPTMPAGAEEGIVRGMYLVQASRDCKSPRVQLLGSGALLREALAAAELLDRDWGIGAEVWSVTSFTELRRSALEVERWNRLNPAADRRLSWVEQCLAPTSGPVVAVTDYVRAVPDLIRTWVPRRYVTLGTDGFGRSDTRAALRCFFEVDHKSMALAAISALADGGVVDRSLVSDFMARYQYTPAPRPSWADHSQPSLADDDDALNPATTSQADKAEKAGKARQRA